MRSVSTAGAALALAGIATVAGTAMPAFAAGPQISVSPSVSAPGTSVSFSVFCGAKATSATLFGTTLGLSEQIPMSKETQAEAGEFTTTVKIPASTLAGSYSPSIDCSNGVSGTATLTVRTAVVKPVVVVPIGAPVTGDGITSTATGGPLTAVGLGLLGASSIAGAFIVRRRKANASK
jgi:hypothetical protein